MGFSLENLMKAVLSLSISKEWKKTVFEWELIDTEEDEEAESKCICGKENIRYLHKIKNKYNDNELFPVGSTCIKKFERADLNELMVIKERLFKLYHAVQNEEFIALDNEIFSRKLIKYLYEQGAFETNNLSFPAIKNYQFILNMFNKKNKKDITKGERRRISAIILNAVKPYVIKQINNKIIHK